MSTHMVLFHLFNGQDHTVTVMTGNHKDHRRSSSSDRCTGSLLIFLDLVEQELNTTIVRSMSIFQCIMDRRAVTHFLSTLAFRDHVSTTHQFGSKGKVLTLGQGDIQFESS